MAKAVAVRHKIVQSLLALLAEIPDNDQRLTQVPIEVTTEWNSPDQFPSFPVLIVVDGPGSTMDLPFMGCDQWQVDYVVTVWGFVRTREDATRHELIEALYEDLLFTVLNSHARLGDTVQRVIPIGERFTDEGQEEPFGWFAQDFVIRYMQTIPTSAG